MKILKAFIAGIRSVNRSKRYILLVYLVSLVIAIVLGLTLADTIQNSLGSSLAGENMLYGFDGLWYGSFSEQASGLASTFDPGVVNIGAVLNGLDAVLSGNLLEGYIGIAGIGILYLLMWTFFSAGFISIYAKSVERPSFFQQAARFFPRFVILAILAGVLYFLLFYFLMNWLSNAVNALTRETIDERIHFAYTVVKYAILWILVLVVNMLFDYSKIITVMEDHKNALTAPLKAASIVFTNFIKTFGLYLLIGLCWVVLMLIYWLVALRVEGFSLAAILGAFFLGQLYLLSRIGARCMFYAGQTAMCSTISKG